MLTFRNFLKLSRPIPVILSILTYGLGAGIARYLGHPIHVPALFLGLLAVLLFEVASFWLVEYFRLPSMPLSKEETPRYRETFRASLFNFSIALLTISGAIVLTLLIARLLQLSALLLLVLIIIFLMSYALPPMKFSETGYGEIILSIVVGTLFPAQAFLLQFGDFHRLLTFATFPITLLALSYFLVNDFPTFATDIKHGRHTLLTRLTWQWAIPIHHLLILVAFLFFASGPIFFGIPWSLVWPAFLVLPFAIFQIFWMQRISVGGRTFWKFLITLSVATFALTTYFLVMTFWIR